MHPDEQVITEGLKKLGMFLIVALGLIIMLIGLFIFSWALALANAPASYGGPTKIRDYLMSLAIMALGFVIIVAPAWIGKKSSKSEDN